NLTRNLGGAFGLAMINTVLTERTRYHSRVLLDNLDMGRSLVNERIAGLTAAFDARGAVDPAGAAMKTISMIVEREASVLAFADTLRVIFWISVAAALVLLFVKPPKAAVSGGH
ncbi:MAG: hypothetical protein RIE56_14380, partial [Amphiplicatus sp.]